MSLQRTGWRASAVLTAVVALCILLLVAGPGLSQEKRCPPAQPDEDFRMLFDGTAESLRNWSQSGPGGFEHEGCNIESYGGLGLFWYEAEKFGDYTLKLDWRTQDINDNSGVFVGFPNPGDDPWTAVNEGYEVQIYDNPGGYDPQKTGTIYDFQSPSEKNSNSPGEWNTYEITVDDPEIRVELNGEVVNEFISTDPERDLSEGLAGVQNHDGDSPVQFRDIQIKERACPDPDSRESVVVDGRDSGVPNRDVRDGCTINDLVSEDGHWASHGRFVEYVDTTTDELVADEVVDGRQKGAIMSVAGQSDVGK